MNLKFKYKHWFILLIITGAIALGIVYAKIDFREITGYLIDEKTHPVAFILLFVLLPVVGFPILPLLLLVGAKFGARMGILILFASMPVHLCLAFVISHSFLHPYLLKFANKNDIDIYQCPEDKALFFSFMFMTIPGLSYAMKNYLLPLFGIPFRYHLIIGTISQGGLSIPFIIAGNAVGTRRFIIPGIFLVLLAGYVLVIWFRKSKGKKMPWTKSDRENKA